MVLREMLGFIEDVRLGVNLEAGIRQAQAGRDLADPDDRYRRIVHSL